MFEKTRYKTPPLVSNFLIEKRLDSIYKCNWNSKCEISLSNCNWEIGKLNYNLTLSNEVRSDCPILPIHSIYRYSDSKLWASTYFLLCWTSLNWFVSNLGRPTSNVHITLDFCSDQPGRNSGPPVGMWTWRRVHAKFWQPPEMFPLCHQNYCELNHI